MKTGHTFHQILYSTHVNRLRRDGTLQKFTALKVKVHRFLTRELKGKLAGNLRTSGSMAKKTAINHHLDLDMVVPFQWGAFGEKSPINQLKAMRNHLQKLLEKEFDYRKSFVVRSQNVSTGISEVLKGKGLDKILIDVVPGMEKGKDHFRKGGNDRQKKFLYLFPRNDGQPILTNIDLQIAAVKKLEHWREIIRLLKIWKHKECPDLSSYSLELLVWGAVKDLTGPMVGSIAPRLIYVLKWLGKNLPSYSLVEIGTGKTWEDFMPTKRRQNLANRFLKLANKIDSATQPNDLFELFPPNEKYLK